MNIIDGIILVPLLFFGFQGFRNGLLREVMGLGGVIAALFLGFRYMDELQTLLSNILDIEAIWLSILAFVLIFMGVIIAVQLLIHALEAVLKMALLSVPNRVLGMLFGLLKSAIFLSVLFILMLGLGLPGEDSREDSLLYEYVVPVAPAAYNVIGSVYPGTESFSETFQKALDEFDF